MTASGSEAFSDLHRLGYIVVTPAGPKDGGDFGKYTPGTKTAGIQEALNYAKTLNTAQHSRKSIYIAAGDYDTTATIHVPWMGERFTFEAARTWINYLPKTGDAIVIDSQMNCRFYFGYVSGLNLTNGWIVRLQPQDPGPSAPLPQERRTPVITCSLFDFNAIVARGWYKHGITGARGNGLLLDGSKGPIVWNRVTVSEVNTCEVGVCLNTNSSFNNIHVWFDHGCQTHLQIGESCAQNRIGMSINSEGVPDSLGAQIFGSKNILNLSVAMTAPGKNVVFEGPAQDNLVYAMNLPNGISNKSTKPTNRIIGNDPVGFDLKTPAVPLSGTTRLNRNPYIVQIIMTEPGGVSKYAISDAKGRTVSIEAPITRGQSFTLGPGEGIAFTYTSAPTWKWRAIR